MKRLAILLLLVLCCSSCGQTTAGTAGPLQHLDRVRGLTQRTAQDSALLALEWRGMGVVLAQARTGGTERDARQVRAEARRLREDAGRALGELQLIPMYGMKRPARQYIGDGAASLRADWWEGLYVGEAAGIVQRDPLLMVGNDLHDMLRLQAAAERSAGRAVAMVQAAHRVRVSHRSAFRYVPSGTSS